MTGSPTNEAGGGDGVGGTGGTGGAGGATLPERVRLSVPSTSRSSRT